jgi:hypothetical protein
MRAATGERQRLIDFVGRRDAIEELEYGASGVAGEGAEEGGGCPVSSQFYH